MRKLLWVLSLAVPLFSCGDRDTAVTAKRAFPQEKRIQAVKCPVGDVMDPSYMIQKGDYLLVRSGQPKNNCLSLLCRICGSFVRPEIRGEARKNFLHFLLW